MKLEKLGSTDLKVSSICYGCGNFGEKLDRDAAFYVLDRYTGEGGNFLDTANVYCRWVEGLANSSEQILGEWLKSRKKSGKVVIATKGGHYDFRNPQVSRVNKKEITRDLEESLKTLGLDTIDFYWLHRDKETKEIGEILDIMEELVKTGKIRYYGASNFKLWRLQEADHCAKHKGYQGFSAVSNQWCLAKIKEGSPLYADKTLVRTESGLLNWHKETQMPLLPFTSSGHGIFEKMAAGPLVSPFLETYGNSENEKLYQELLKKKEETGASLYALSLKALREQGFPVIPICSAGKISQMDGILEALHIC